MIKRKVVENVEKVDVEEKNLEEIVDEIERVEIEEEAIKMIEEEVEQEITSKVAELNNFINQQANYLIAFLCQAVEDKNIAEADTKYLRTALKQGIRSLQRKISSYIEKNDDIKEDFKKILAKYSETLKENNENSI